MMDLLYVYFICLWSVFGGLYHGAKFAWDQCSSLDNKHVLIFYKFGLKMPIYASFCIVLEGLDP